MKSFKNYLENNVVVEGILKSNKNELSIGHGKEYVTFKRLTNNQLGIILGEDEDNYMSADIDIDMLKRWLNE